MNTQSHDARPSWTPIVGVQLHKTGVQFDAVQINGVLGRDIADLLMKLTSGDPGPIVTESNGAHATYFLVPVGSASHRPWPPGVTRPDFVPVPAVDGGTWPLAWRSAPRTEERFVHGLMLHQASWAISSATTAHASAAGSISGK
ncbi:hypothetical protein [Streptomyces sp. NPDC002054]|uniref:hypothetical protein n=1 Tax=Streptomyces sp. NPDC002054 TaxID=3154663 RepID=UPI00332AAA3D